MTTTRQFMVYRKRVYIPMDTLSLPVYHTLVLMFLLVKGTTP